MSEVIKRIKNGQRMHTVQMDKYVGQGGLFVQYVLSLLYVAIL